MNNLTLTAIPGLRVGHHTDTAAATGCTVVLCEAGAVGGVCVSGAAPGARESDLLREGMLVTQVHAVLLGGGSAYGLAAADGVMRYLEERNVGFDTRAARVPIVPAAILYDLNVGSPTVRPGTRTGLRGLPGGYRRDGGRREHRRRDRGHSRQGPGYGPGY